MEINRATHSGLWVTACREQRELCYLLTESTGNTQAICFSFLLESGSFGQMDFGRWKSNSMSGYIELNIVFLKVFFLIPQIFTEHLLRAELCIIDWKIDRIQIKPWRGLVFSGLCTYISHYCLCICVHIRTWGGTWRIQRRERLNCDGKDIKIRGLTWNRRMSMKGIPGRGESIRKKISEILE